MSYSNGQQVEEDLKNIQTTGSQFENFIMQCCKADEWELRKFLRKVLTRSGFTIHEDGYQTDRVKKDKRYSTVHNMLAIRGDKPQVCLVAHTDVCRDHENSRYSMIGDYSWMSDNNDKEISIVSKSKISEQKVEPVIKMIEHEGQMRRIIQDKNCQIQVGGDDRLGVAINTWIALNTGYDMGLFFPTDEEIGLKSAGDCKMERLKEFELCVQVDRGNHSNQLVPKIGNTIICEYDKVVHMLEIAYNMGMPREIVCGLGTDVYALYKNGYAKNAVNMTTGYHNSRGAQKDEYIEIQEARDTMKFVSEIVKSYYLGEAPKN